MSSEPNLEGVFTKVIYKKKEKCKNKRSNITNFDFNQVSDDPSFNTNLNIKKISDAKQELLSTDLYKSMTALLKEGLNSLDNPKISRIICLGLGKISQNLVSRFQFALLLCLKDLYQVEVQVYDPIFCRNDMLLLEHFTIEIEKNNLEAKYEVKDKTTTLFLLPHCPKQLTNNLLWANWGRNLNYCIIIANSFSKIVDNTNKKDLSISAEYISHISPYVFQLDIINSFKYFEIFNDTAIHFFPWSRLKMIPVDFWDRSHEPDYLEDVEFISKMFENKLGF